MNGNKIYDALMSAYSLINDEYDTVYIFRLDLYSFVLPNAIFRNVEDGIWQNKSLPMFL